MLARLGLYTLMLVACAVVTVVKKKGAAKLLALTAPRSCAGGVQVARRGVEKLAAVRGFLEMKVKRIVADIHSPDIALAKRFYHDLLGLDLLMDLGWIATYGSREQMSIQISFASQGGSHTPTPDLSIEVDDIEGALEGMRKAGFPIEYGPADEPWGVRRFYVRDPFGKLVNILAHADSD
jgi:catechol 2,3-dioxygenase-like lactoylglutathione lyase family enzyme